MNDEELMQDPLSAIPPAIRKYKDSRLTEIPDFGAQENAAKPYVGIGILCEKLDDGTLSSVFRDIVYVKGTLSNQQKLAVFTPHSVELLTKFGRVIPGVDFISGNYEKCQDWVVYYYKNKPALPEGVSGKNATWVQVADPDKKKSIPFERSLGDPGLQIDNFRNRTYRDAPIAQSPNHMTMPAHNKVNQFSPHILLFSSVPAQKPKIQIRASQENMTTEDTSSMYSQFKSTEFAELLPSIAPIYKLSSNPDDYFMKPVIMFHSDMPNRNGYLFPTKSLIEWNDTRKMLAYQTWKYCPLHIEHKTDIKENAIGLIADVILRKAYGVCNGQIYKVIALAAVDRTKNPSYTSKIEQGKLNSWSMGCDASHISCSYCGAPEGECSHIDKHAPVQFYELNGNIVCRAASGLSGMELSSVGTPAWPMAVNSKTTLKF